MRIWRICREPYAIDPLEGKGGFYTSGRWHTKGRPVVYTSSTLSLAALELLVHVSKSTFPSDLVQLEIDIPDTLKIEKVDTSRLPGNWKSYPAPAELRTIGDDWLTACSTPVLQVPSAIIPEESNLILNPQHADMSKITVVSTEVFTYDPRISSKGR